MARLNQDFTLMRKNDKKHKSVNLRLISLITVLLVFTLFISVVSANNDAGNDVAAVLEDIVEKVTVLHQG